MQVYECLLILPASIWRNGDEGELDVQVLPIEYEQLVFSFIYLFTCNTTGRSYLFCLVVQRPAQHHEGGH